VLGHIGDGNYHTLVIMNPDDPSDLQRAEDVNHAIVEYALSRGGTCTGEHGVGVGKMKYQRQEHGQALDVMNNLKKMFDPNNILNPGKVIPRD